MSPDAVLQVRGLTMNFGGLRALAAIDLEVRRKEIVALIGPNGAGKTTFFNCITCVHAPDRGDMVIQAPGKAPRRINGLKPNAVTELGIARTFQNIRLFKEMSVLENVMVGRHCRTRAGIAGAVFSTKRARVEERECADFAYSMLAKVGLENRADEKASELPYGAQRRLEIARALATEPFLLLLDEPAAGMNPSETDEMDALVKRIRDEGISILIIEHDMNLVMSISDRIYVLDYGNLIASGTPREVSENQSVIRAYIGESCDA